MADSAVAQADDESGFRESPMGMSPPTPQRHRPERDPTGSSQQSYSSRADRFEGMPNLNIKATDGPSSTGNPSELSSATRDIMDSADAHRREMVSADIDGSDMHGADGASAGNEMSTRNATPPPAMDADPMEWPRATSPEPMFKTISEEGSASLHHPSPDLQSLQGAYVDNVRQLERSAERLSISSDYEDELRKLREEQRHTEGRQSSLSRQPFQEEHQTQPPAYRQVSASSLSHSIVGANSTARSGGYSLGGYVTSPLHSIRSGDSLSRGRSGFRRAPLAAAHDRDDQFHESTTSSSYQVVSRPQSLHSVEDAPAASGHAVIDARGNRHTSPLEPEPQYSNQYQPDESLDRPGSAASGDTFDQARQLFHDFDGTHYMPHFESSGPGSRSSGVRRASMMSRARNRPVSYAGPPPGENMVYYPAPVPVMLNLPQRLSKLPSPTQREKRRTQVIETVPDEARKSAAWLPGVLEGEDDAEERDQPPPRASVPRRSVAHLSNLPPQLRASAFFDQPAIRQDVQLKGESAVATLDSILDASAHAPVSAFTDHPIAGRAGAGIYAKDASRRVSSTVMNGNVPARRSRSSLSMLLGRKSKMDLLEEGVQTKQQGPTIRPVSQLGFERLSTRPDEDEDEAEQMENALLRRSSEQRGSDGGAEMASQQREHYDDEDENADHQNYPQGTESVNGEVYGGPTTLLAELQLRKEEQRHRNKPAATTFPGGMHSTLLEMDAVAQRQKESRQNKRVALAWEDPESKLQEVTVDDDDDDVPLGMLFPNQAANKQLRRGQQSRPFGLMDRRDVEDNEPLSVRRNRLKGNPAPEDKVPAMYQLDIPDIGGGQDEASDEEGETLAQRMRRLRARGPDAPRSKSRAVSDDFASDLLSQFGGDLGKPKEPVETEEKKEETLGQRRRRLQAEREAKASTANQGRPQILQRHSMADLVQAHPAAGAKPTNSTFAQNISRSLLGPTAQITPSPYLNQQYGQSVSQPHLQDQHQHRHTMGYAQGVAVSNPMLWNQMHPNAGVGEMGWNGMAPMYTQGMGPGGMPMMPFNQSPLDMDTRQRDVIDQWRQSVHP